MRASDFLAETFTAPLAAARGPAGRHLSWANALVVLAVGSLGSTVAAWLLAGRGAGNLGGLGVIAAGRLLLDTAVWLVVSGLLGAVAAGAGHGGAVPGQAARAATEAELLVLAAQGSVRESLTEADKPIVTPSWHVALAVVGAQRAWLAPAAAGARLIGAAGLGGLLRPGIWLWMVGLVYLMACERGHGVGSAVRLLALGLLLPLVLAVAGLLLSGLGWLLTPLWPGGITPFIPL